MSASPRFSIASRVVLSGHAQIDEAFHRRLFAPVIVVGLQHELDARLHADEFIRTEADWMLLVTVRPDLLEIIFRRDPAGGAPQRAVSGHEIRPWLVEDEPHRVRIDDDDLLDLLLELRPLGALEAEFDVLGGERVAVVEFHSLAQLEFITELVRAFAPGFGQAWRHVLSRHRLHERVVQRILHPEWRQIAGACLARIEPSRRDRHVHREPDFALGLGLRIR